MLFQNNPLNFEHMVHLPTNTKTFLILRLKQLQTISHK